jgi:hypothetical protein
MPLLLDAGFTDVTTKPLQRNLCRDILEQHGHVLPPEKEKPEAGRCRWKVSKPVLKPPMA